MDTRETNRCECCNAFIYGTTSDPKRCYRCTPQGAAGVAAGLAHGGVLPSCTKCYRYLRDKGPQERDDA